MLSFQKSPHNCCKSSSVPPCFLERSATPSSLRYQIQDGQYPVPGLQTRSLQTNGRAKTWGSSTAGEEVKAAPAKQGKECLSFFLPPNEWANFSNHSGLACRVVAWHPSNPFLPFITSILSTYRTSQLCLRPRCDRSWHFPQEDKISFDATPETSVENNSN